MNRPSARTAIGKRFQEGFTLVELIVAMSILVLAVALGTAFFVFMLRFFAQAAAVRASQENLRFAFEEMFRQIRLAQGFRDALPTDTTDACKIPKGFERGSSRITVIETINEQVRQTPPTAGLVAKNSRSEIIRFTVKPFVRADGRRVYSVVTENFGTCNHFNTANAITTRLTGDDVNVLDLSFYRDDKYCSYHRGAELDAQGRACARTVADPFQAPSLLVIRLRVSTCPRDPDASGRPGLPNAAICDNVFSYHSFGAEQTISLRSEFSNFFREEPL